MKSFAEMELESYRKATKKCADDLLWQLSNGGIDNIHVRSTAQALINCLNIQGAWVKVVEAENCVTPLCERSQLESHTPVRKFSPGDIAKAKRHIELTGASHTEGQKIIVTKENVVYFNSAHGDYVRVRK
jgi:hypothetical protein